MNSLFEEPKQSPGYLLWRISTLWRSSIEGVLKKMGLTHPQFVILAVTGWLTKNGDLVTQASIGKMACLDPNTASQVIKGLEKKGYIERKCSEDTRAKHPILTKEGNEILIRALPAVEMADKLFFKKLSQNEVEMMASIFAKLC